MRWLVSKLIAVVVIVGIGWALGDRYGTPAVVNNVVAPYLDQFETMIGLERSESSDDVETAQEKAETKLEKKVEVVPPVKGDVSQNDGLRINNAGLDIIKASEGLRLEAYSSGGRSYIGYGHQRQPGDPSSITEVQADTFLRQDVKYAEDGVRRLLTRPATENQFSAMVSLAYNLGVGGFGRSSVLSEFNDGDIQGAADAFLNHNKAGGQVLDHLTHRREQERELFLR